MNEHTPAAAEEREPTVGRVAPEMRDWFWVRYEYGQQWRGWFCLGNQRRGERDLRSLADAVRFFAEEDAVGEETELEVLVVPAAHPCPIPYGDPAEEAEVLLFYVVCNNSSRLILDCPDGERSWP